MKKTLLLLFLFAFTGIFAQGPFQPTQFNNVCDDNNDGFAQFFMQEITSEITGGATNLVVTHYETQADAANNTNSITTNTYSNNVPNQQTLFASVLNLSNNQVQILAYQITVNPLPIATPITITGCYINGTTNATFDLNNASQIIWNQNQSNPNSQYISYHLTQADALNGSNSISNTLFTTTSNPQTVFYRVENIQSGCFSTSTLTLLSQNCNNPNCPTPTNVIATNITNNSAALAWSDSGSSTSWEVLVSVNGVQQLSTTITANPYVLTGLPCNSTIGFQVRSICSGTEISAWSSMNFQTTQCLQVGQPSDLNSCLINGSACFDLTQNTVPVLGNLNPSTHSVSYHLTSSSAASNANAITNPSNYCVNSNQAIYARVEENANPSNYQLSTFNITPQTVVLNINNSIATLNECDDNSDGQVIFDLTEAAINMNNASAVSYYTSQSNAVNNVSPISNPTTYSTGLQPVSTFVFARATYQTSCDIIYKINLKAYALCNNAYTCSAANSLCSSLGQPFLNTFQGITAEAGNNYGCLGSQPNPTWFYLPVSQAGNLSFLIEQSSNINFPTANLDVDYICYGPFSSPSAGCNAPLTSIVGCSYSSASVETVNIPNALPGQYYLIMVTNFSNQAGYIRVTQLGTSQGALDCSGLQLNAFLDLNANGTQETGEINFPLGTFTYQLNNNGNNINVTSPFGEYAIYDDNAANSYNLSYAVLPEYAAYYGITTSSFTNVSVVVGAGLQTYNFPVTVTQPYVDVATYIIPSQQPRPGFTYKNKVVYANLGSQTVASGTLTFTKNNSVVITNITQTGTTPDATGFTYNYSNLLPFEVRFMDVIMQVPNIPTVQLGQLLTNSASITPLTGDVVPLNNTNSSSQIIIGSYDPNDKMESRGSQILHSSFTANDYLYYTIRFENTGTASAINIRVEDMLDAKLDEGSIRMISSSHEYTMERMGTSLKWYFDNVQLPPSVVNTDIGKGYITFKVKPKPGYAIGDIIPNTANIYFDYNPAIVTNTFNSEFIAPLAINTFTENNITMYPNPAKNQVTISLDNTNEVIANVNVIDMLGKQVIRLNKVNEVTKSIDLSALNSGIYFIEIETQNKLVVKRKLIVN